MKIKVSLLIFFCFFFNTSLNAEEKTKYIDVDKIISGSEPGSNLLNQLSIIEKKFITNFKLEDEKFLVEKNNILSSKNIITKEEYEKKILSYQDKLDVYKTKKKDTFKDLKKKRNLEIRNFLQMINPLIENYMKNNSIVIILDKKNVFIAKANHDITNDIIEIINKNITKFKIKE